FLLLRTHEPLCRGNRNGGTGEKGRSDRLCGGQRIRAGRDDGEVSAPPPFRDLCAGKPLVAGERSDQSLPVIEGIGPEKIKTPRGVSASKRKSGVTPPRVVRSLLQKVNQHSFK